MFEDLCDLQRQAQHFLTVLQAARNSPAPAIDRSCGLDMEHADDENAAVQMAELIVKVHRYAHLPPASDPVTSGLILLMGIHVMTALFWEAAQTLWMVLSSLLCSVSHM